MILKVFMVVFCIWLSVGSAVAAAERPNIIFCMTDDQGWGDTSYNGHPELKTPNLDAMAEAGVRFDRFYAFPMCSPARASCLTGRSAIRYRCDTWGHELPLREVTYAEVAKTAGYATGHFGKWHLGGLPSPSPEGKGYPEHFDSKPRHPGNQGFDEWFTAANWYDIGYEHIYPPRPCSHLYHNGKEVPPSEMDTSDQLVEVALEWIRKQVTQEKPFLAAIWFPSPHGPHKALPKDAALYENYGVAKANYYGEIAGVDRAMGHLRKALREMKIAENTLLCFCSDNGGLYFVPLSTGGLPGRKGQLNEGGTRVPCIIEWPARISKPFITKIPASVMDFYPTVLDILGVTASDQIKPVDGISLLPLIEGEIKHRSEPIPLSFFGTQVRVIDNDYIFQNNHLFRVTPDGRNPVDISKESPEVFNRLQAYEKKFRASVGEDRAYYSRAPEKKTKDVH